MAAGAGLDGWWTILDSLRLALGPEIPLNSKVKLIKRSFHIFPPQISRKGVKRREHFSLKPLVLFERFVRMTIIF